MTQLRGLALALLPTVTVLAGCLETQPDLALTPSPTGVVSSQVVFVHNALDQLLDPSRLDQTINLATSVFDVGQQGPEPSIGVTSNGYVFFQALERTVVSKDHGRTWARVAGPLTATGTSDPYLWVDPTTDRVFQVNMGLPFGGRGPINPGLPAPAGGMYNAITGLFCAHIAWSDDYGATWLANPVDCGPIPGNDHEKLTTGPWVGARSTLAQNPAYPNAVYYAYNKVITTGAPQEPETAAQSPGATVAVSFDGGATFPVISKSFDPGCNGTLHGAIVAGPDGTVYVPARYCPSPLVATSRDNGLTWTQTFVGASAGVPKQMKNPEMAVDRENNAYVAWTGKDNRLHLSHSSDHGATWTDPVPLSPAQVGSTIWPAVAAGDAGRVGIAYIGTEDSNAGAWTVDNSTRWHLYYTYSLNALDPNPTFVTIRATDDSDPVQRGTICVSSSACKSGNRNLLDFIDLVIDAEGRPYVAYADGCTSAQCLRPGAGPLDSRSRQGYVMVLEQGPSLIRDAGLLIANP